MTDAWDGRPANPERDGDHWVSDANSDVVTAHWNAEIQCWGAWPYTSAAHMAENNSYLGPCLTPVEVAAREEAAWRAGRDAAAAYVVAKREGRHTLHCNPLNVLDDILAAIRALTPPATLAAAVDAVAQEREAIAKAIYDCPAFQGDEWGKVEWRDGRNSQRQNEAFTLADAAIRARGGSASA